MDKSDDAVKAKPAPLRGDDHSTRQETDAPANYPKADI